jgi:hypothetical protein
VVEVSTDRHEKHDSYQCKYCYCEQKQRPLDNFFVEAGITQILCVLIMVGVSLCTQPREVEEIKSLLWSKDKLFLPPAEGRKPWYKSVGLWAGLLLLFYAVVVAYLW